MRDTIGYWYNIKNKNSMLEERQVFPGGFASLQNSVVGGN
jgi:hypothetical protein